MNRLQTAFMAALVTLFSLTATAHASTINITLGNTSSDFTYGSGGNIPSANLNLATMGSDLVLNSNAQIIAPPSTVSSQYIQPSGGLYGDNYLAVLGRPSAGMATFTLASDTNKFAFTWGTIDAYNSLKLQNFRNITFTITGADILSHIAGSVAGTTQSDVSFYDPFGTITMAQIVSTDNAFEAANFSATDPPASVPLPPAFFLFAAALMGLALITHRNRVWKFFQM